MNTNGYDIDYIKKKYGRLEGSKKKLYFGIAIALILGIVLCFGYNIIREPQSFNPFESYKGPAYFDAWICEGPFAEGPDNELYYLGFTEYDEPYVVVGSENKFSIPVYGEDFDDDSYPEEFVLVQGKQKKIDDELLPFLVDWYSYYDETVDESNILEYVGEYCLDLNDSGYDYTLGIVFVIALVVLLVVILVESSAKKIMFKSSIKELSANGQLRVIENELRYASAIEDSKLALFITNLSIIWVGNANIVRVAFADMVNVYGSNIINDKYDYNYKAITVEKKSNVNSEDIERITLSKVNRNNKKSNFDDMIRIIRTKMETSNMYARTQYTNAEETMDNNTQAWADTRAEEE